MKASGPRKSSGAALSPTPPAETGTIRKKWTGRLAVALLYPNRYPVAVSNLGCQLAYALLNDCPDIVCERFVYPERGEALRSLESSRPLSDFPIVCASVSFEHDFPRLPALLAAGGVPPMAADRAGRIGPGEPLVVIGGVAMLINPEPPAAFADLVAVGEAEAILPQLLPLLLDAPGRQREDLLAEAAHLPGCYAPALYEHRYDAEGRLAGIIPARGAPPRVKKALAAVPEVAGHSRLYSSEAELDMHMVELGRGCGQSCRFCAAGYVYRPPRLWPREAVARALAERPGDARRIGLLGLEMSDELDAERLAGAIAAENCLLSFSSLRADRLSPPLLAVLERSALKSVAIAADGASERLRRVINKRITAGQLVDAAVKLVESGIFHLKIYVMIGLPGETAADLEEFAELARTIHAAVLPLGRARGRVCEIAVSLNCFVPKAWTPFQFCAFGGQEPAAATAEQAIAQTLAELKGKIRMIKKMLADTPNLRLNADSPEQALEQAVYARADRRIAPALLARGGGLAFRQAMKRVDDLFGDEPGVAIRHFALRERDEGEIFPWDIIDHGFLPGYMWQEYGRALRERAAAPCQPPRCRTCGVCHVQTA